MTLNISRLSNNELVAETKRAAGDERNTTAQLVSLLAEFDARRLYLRQGWSSLFAWCTNILHLSEHAAYHRIEAARAAREFPVILERLAAGDVTLTAIGLLRPHLTSDNYLALLDAARHQSKREVERLVAGLAPKADVPPLVRRLAVIKPISAAPLDHQHPATTHRPSVDLATDRANESPAVETVIGDSDARVERPSASDRYLVRLTISGETHAKLQRARDLLRHTIPSGDPAAIVDRALTVLVEQLERVKCGATSRPRPGRGTNGRNERAGARESRERSRAHGVPASERPRARDARYVESSPKPKAEAEAAIGSPGGEAPGPVSTRHIPAAVRRAVWARDGGRCSFVGAEGRCKETGRLEFHHVTPYARGGPTDVANLALRCRAHNGYEGRLAFGARTRSGPSRGGAAPSQSGSQG